MTSRCSPAICFCEVVLMRGFAGTSPTASCRWTRFPGLGASSPRTASDCWKWGSPRSGCPSSSGWDVSGCWRAARGERWGWSSSASMPRFCWRARLEVYPLGTGRADIFAFPVSILLLASGAHLATSALPAVRLFRFAIAALVVTVVLVWPPRADYVGNVMNDLLLVEVLAAHERPDDGVIMTWQAGFLTAFYGQWPFENRRLRRGAQWDAGEDQSDQYSASAAPPFSTAPTSGPEKRPRANSCGDSCRHSVVAACGSWLIGHALLGPGLWKHLSAVDTPSTKCARPAKERCL